MRQKRYWVLLVVGMLVMCGSVWSTSTLTPPPNIRITAIPQLNNEEQVFICPTDSNIIIANWRDFRTGYRQIGVGRSIDGGQTWTDSLISVDMQYFNFSSWQSDPTMAVDRLGNFYMSALDFLSAGGPGSSVIAFYRSLDKGVSWEGPYTPDPPPGSAFEDKQFITVDRTGGPYDGNLYCAWARFYEGPNRIMFVRSTDGGVTFDDSVMIGPPQGSTACGTGYDAGQFAIPIVGADGSVHVFWMGSSLDSGVVCDFRTMIKHRISTNGGVSFGPERLVQEVTGYMTAAGSINTYSMPVGDVDISGGVHHGNMYLAFSTIGPEGGLSDVDFIRSTDGGLNWSSPLQINDDPQSHLNSNFHPWMIVNEDGVIICVFYDERFDPNHYNFDLLAAYSFDGGVTWTSNHRISSASSSPGSARDIPLEEPIVQVPIKGQPALVMSPQAGKIGEYIGVTAFHDKLNAVWTDTRDGNQEVYTANWYMPMLEPRLMSPSNGVHLKSVEGFGGQPMPPSCSWATSWKENDDNYRIELIAPSFPFPDTLRFTSTSNSFAHWMGDPPMGGYVFVPGTYKWRVKTFNSTMTDSSAWSETWTFYLDVEGPTVPSLVSPADGSTTFDLTPLLDWTTSSDPSLPVTYELTLSSDSLFPVGPLTQVVSGLTVSEYQVTTNLALDQYFWKVSATDGVGWTSNSLVGDFTVDTSCCSGVTGNVNDGPVEQPDLSDLSLMIAYLTQTPRPVLPCLSEANINVSGSIDLSDLSILINYLTVSGQSLPACPSN